MAHVLGLLIFPFCFWFSLVPYFVGTGVSQPPVLSVHPPWAELSLLSHPSWAGPPSKRTDLLMYWQNAQRFTYSNRLRLVVGMREMTIMQHLMENKRNTNNKRTTKVETMLDTMKMVGTQLQHRTAAEKHCLGLYPGVLYSTNNASMIQESTL